jgi:hypothetical protein
MLFSKQLDIIDLHIRLLKMHSKNRWAWLSICVLYFPIFWLHVWFDYIHAIGVIIIFEIYQYINMLNVQVYAEGTHLIILWFERPVIYDVCAKPHVAESTSGCRDLRMVNLYLVSVSESCQDYVFKSCGCIGTPF